MTRVISTNPANNYEVIGEVESSTDAEIQTAVKGAVEVKTAWKETDLDRRAELLKSILAELEERADEIADLMTKEMGKPISQSKEEVEGYLEEFAWYMDNVKIALKPIVTHETETLLTTATYEPHGVVAVITPWNFPFGLSILGIVPNLLVGNAVIYKASEETILLGKLIGEIFNNHNLPKGVFNVLYGAGDVGKKLTESDIDFIWFTGSSKVGRTLYQTAAKKMINVLLELGGSSPCIVFEDADLESAVKTVYENRFLNTGQVCDVIKRVIVNESVFDKFVTKLRDEVECKVLCDPKQSEADLGPLVAERQLILLEAQVNESVAKGAKVITGGKRPESHKGAYYEPTILTEVTADMRVWNEEVFGPVVPIVKFKTEAEAIELANDTEYGLGGRVITADMKRALRVAAKIEAGSVEINEGDRWASPNNPFGGYKMSGIGRENGAVGFQALCQVKVISRSK